MGEIPKAVVREALEQAAWNKRRAAADYWAAVELAHSQGWGHTEIARVCGVTEGAIRLMLKRGRRLRVRRR